MKLPLNKRRLLIKNFENIFSARSSIRNFENFKNDVDNVNIIFYFFRDDKFSNTFQS